MDMKKILQTLDGASKPVEGSNDMKKFLQVVSESNINQPAVDLSENNMQDLMARINTAKELLAKMPESPNKMKAGEHISAAEENINAGNSVKALYHIAQFSRLAGAMESVEVESKPKLRISEYILTVEKELMESANVKSAKASKLAKRVIERITLPPEPTAAEPTAAPAAAPTSKKTFTQGVTFPAPYTLSYNGKEYKFAGRDKEATGEGEVIVVPAGSIGMRGIAPVRVQLGGDGTYYLAPAAAGLQEKQGQSSKIKKHLSRATKPPESIMKMAKDGAKINSKRLHEKDDEVDILEMDVPLFLRLLEYAKEDAKTDMDLHSVTEKVIGFSRQGKLSMDQYDALVGDQKALPNELDESLRTENPCWKGYKPVGTKKKNGKTVPNCVPKK